MAAIASDEDVFGQFSKNGLPNYKRIWIQLREQNPDFDFENAAPGEDMLVKFFKFLRFEKKYKSSSMWTLYSYLNALLQRKYNMKLQTIPRLTILVKSFDKDVKQKAKIFEEDAIKSFMVQRNDITYWMVRQVICILAYFGGLRLQECYNLTLERIQRSPQGYFVTHFRVKQRRSDK